jgi:hypothetical protein
MPPRLLELYKTDPVRAEFNRMKAEGARDTLKLIEFRRNYPVWTVPIKDAPAWNPPLPHHEQQEGPKSTEHVLEIWADKAIFVPGDAVIVHARLLNAGKAVKATQITGRLDQPPRSAAPEYDFSFNDEGLEGDAQAGDLIYSARLPITDQEFRSFPGTWGYRVKVSLEDEPIETMNFFTLYPNEVELTGHYRDAMEDGSLAIYVGVRARRPATTQVRGYLLGPHGEEVAFASANHDVAPGESELRLLFYGKAIHDSKIDGPYQLTRVILGEPRLRLVGIAATDVVLTTKPWRAADFRSDPFNKNDPFFDAQRKNIEDLLGKAERGELTSGEGP